MKLSPLPCLISLCLMIFLNACHSDKTTNKNDSLSIKNDTIVKITKDSTSVVVPADSVQNVKMDHGFEAKFTDGENRYTDFLSLYHKNKLIYTGKGDSTEYIYFKEGLYPIVNQLNDSTFEVLIQISDKPSKDKAELFRIEKDKLVVKKKMPTFIAKASDLDGDGVLEYAGAWDNSEEYGINGKLCRSYDPIMYYKLTANGIKLDTIMTKERNAMIYGKFYGFSFDGKTGVPLASGVNERYSKEYKRIENNVK